MDCLVISLKSSIDRRVAVEKEMGRLSMPFRYINAVEGSRFTQPEYYQDLKKEFIEYLPENPKDIALEANVAATYLSHVRAFRYARLHKYPYVLIVEDDVNFCIEDKDILDQLAQTDLNWDCLKLSLTEYPLVRTINVGQEIIHDKKYDYCAYWSGMTGTTCTMYSRTGLEKLTANMPRFGLVKPHDSMIGHWRWRMDFSYLCIRPQLAIENLGLQSTIESGRLNAEHQKKYRDRNKFLARKKRQLKGIKNALIHNPVQHLLRPWRDKKYVVYCLKYLLFNRKKPSKLEGVNILDSIGPGRIFFFRRLRIDIPWADAYLALYDLTFGALYWLTHPKQYPVFRWWCEIARRISEARSPDNKPKTLLKRRLSYLLQQSLYYGQLWRRFHLQKTPKTLLTWNGWRTKWARQAIVPAGVKHCFMELSPLPGFMTMDPAGVNAEISVPREGNFYRAWGLMHPELKSSWQDIGSRITARPKSAGAVTTSHGLIQELPKKFIFIPLQKKDDSQIFLHSSWVYSVDNFIKYVYEASAHLPDDWSIIMKTHPSDTGIRPETVFKDAPKNVFNGELFDSVQLLKSCSALVNINGSMGLQAYFFAKPVVTCGSNFYDFAGMARRCQSVEDLCQVFAGIDSLSCDEPLRKHFLNWLINCYYLEISSEFEKFLVFNQKCNIEPRTRQSFTDRIVEDWDMWSGLGSDPKHWADIIQKNEVATTNVSQLPPVYSDRKIKAIRR